MRFLKLMNGTYAIGEFLDQARKKTWFDNTIFIFVADHTAGSAGQEDLPISNKQIPLFTYAPKLIEARQGLRRHDEALTDSRKSRATASDSLITRAITYYQTASYGFKQKRLDSKAPMEGSDQVSER